LASAASISMGDGPPGVALTVNRLCFTLCGTWAMLHARSRDRIRKNGKISGFGARAEAEGLDCRREGPGWTVWLDSQGDGDCPICGTGPTPARLIFPAASGLAGARDVGLVQATRRVAGSPRAPRFTCHKMGCGAICMPGRASARAPHRVKQSLGKRDRQSTSGGALRNCGLTPRMPSRARAISCD
jgi:hypothetical protein